MNGICGLGNLGNSCYINASLQILSQIHDLNDYLVSIDKLINIPDSIVTFEWIQLYKMIQQNHCSISPNRFLGRMREVSLQKKRKEFSSTQQNDSVDYFLFMQECIHNSLNGLDRQSIACSSDIDSSVRQYITELESKECSVIQQLFLHCSVYQYVDPETKCLAFSRVEHDTILALSIPEKDTITLQDCFVYTFKEELMNQENEWFDEKENRKRPILKRTSLGHTPTIMVLHLKRWKLNFTKKNVIVHTPLVLDLQPFTLNEVPCNYELFGIINHSGSHRCGHYYASIKKGDDWYSMNDHFIQSIPVTQLIHENNYCLFYRKIK
jgi:ubiquitin C-terminal hydrolase